MRKIIISLLLLAPTFMQAEKVDSLLLIIESNNLELKALASESQSRQYELQSENMLAGPSVEYSPFYTKGYHGMSSSELIVSQEFEFPTRYAQRREQNNLQATVDASQWEVLRQSILLEARLLCYDIVRQDQLISLLRERLLQGETITSLIEKRLAAGDATALELNKSKLDHMQTAMQLTEAENDRQQIVLQLQSLNGGQALNVEGLSYPAHLQNHDVRLEALQSSAAQNYPEVVLAQKSLQASEQNERVVRNSWLPNLTIGYRRNTDESIGMNGFLVGASFPIFSNSKQVKSARKRIEADQLRLKEANLKAENTLQSQQEELQRLHTVLDHSDTRLLRETLTLLDKALQQGQISALDYYTECNNVYEKLANHIQLHGNFVKLYAEIYLRK